MQHMIHNQPRVFEPGQNVYVFRLADNKEMTEFPLAEVIDFNGEYVTVRVNSDGSIHTVPHSDVFV